MSQTAKLLLHSPLSAITGNSPSLDSTYRLSSPISRMCGLAREVHVSDKSDIISHKAVAKDRGVQSEKVIAFIKIRKHSWLPPKRLGFRKIVACNRKSWWCNDYLPCLVLVLLTSSTDCPMWRLGRNGDARLSTPKAQGHKLLVAGKDNVFLAKGTKKEVIMVDPLEAKRIAAREMEEIRAREEFGRKRRGEAINGALAMIGLTASLVIEGRTGKGIVGQLYGYVNLIISYVLSIYPEELLDGKIPSYTEFNLFEKFPSITELNLFDKFP
ncbi:hypothetical protein AKJ16_DCAP00810 [Drosera capensis]